MTPTLPNLPPLNDNSTDDIEDDFDIEQSLQEADQTIPRQVSRMTRRQNPEKHNQLEKEKAEKKMKRIKAKELENEDKKRKEEMLRTKPVLQVDTENCGLTSIKVKSKRPSQFCTPSSAKLAKLTPDPTNFAHPVSSAKFTGFG